MVDGMKADCIQSAGSYLAGMGAACTGAVGTVAVVTVAADRRRGYS